MRQVRYRLQRKKVKGAFLVEAEKWRIERNADLSSSEQRYVDASVQARIRREQEDRDRRDRELAQANTLAEALQHAANQEKELATESKERARQAEAHASRLRRRNLILLCAMALLIAAGVFAVAQQGIARREASNARLEADHARHLLAESYKEEGRRFIVDQGRYQEAVPYLLEALRNGLDKAPLRMLFRTAERHLPLVPALEHQAAVVNAAFTPTGRAW